MIENQAYYNKIELFTRNNNVYVAEDIYNNSGLLLIKKGMLLKDSMIEKIKKNKLSKPLDQFIAFEDIIDKTKLLHSIQDIIKEHIIIGEIFLQSENNALTLSECLEEFENHLLIKQKLTMLKDVNPFYYKKSLFSAVLSLIIANKMNINDVETLKSLFMASISNFLGALHISNENIEKNKDNINVISQSILTTIPGMNKKVPTFVIQTNENCYGNGNPKQLSPQYISYESQIIRLCNDYYDALNLSSHEEFYQTIMVTYKSYFDNVSNAFIFIFKEYNKFDKNLFEARTKELLDLLKEVHQTFSFIKRNSIVYTQKMDNIPKKQFLRIFENLLIFERSSGIIHDTFQRWVKHVYDNKIIIANEEMQSTLIMIKVFQKRINFLLKLAEENISEKEKLNEFAE